jgi:deoxyribonuclease IV
LTPKRPIGFHIRIKDNYTDLALYGQELGASVIQCFLMPKEPKRYLYPKAEDRRSWLDIKKRYFKHVYAHSSYWVVPAIGKKISSKISHSYLQKEISIAKKLEIDTIIIHPGSATGYAPALSLEECKMEGIKALSRMLNDVLKDEPTHLLLENTAHGNKAVGSDLTDFVKLRPFLKWKTQIGFCLDTAHAYAYGYDVTDTEDFVQLLDETMGIHNIKLIHLNDSDEPLGSKIDKHSEFGEGFIGKEALKRLVTHPKMNHIPIIVEPPPLSQQKMQELMNELNRW